MMDNILKSLDARNEFVGHLEEGINKNSLLLEDLKKELDKLKELSENIKTLGKYPEHSSLIPLAKNIYMRGNIIHTGEYYITKPAYPESYTILQSLDQTLNSLEERIRVKNSEVEKAQYADYQLNERMRILKGDTEDTFSGTLGTKDTENEDLPKEIISEKGVAVKVGEFYEILEFDD